MPVLSSRIGFLYLLALISSEPVAIGGPVAPPVFRCWRLSGLLGKPILSLFTVIARSWAISTGSRSRSSSSSSSSSCSSSMQSS